MTATIMVDKHRGFIEVTVAQEQDNSPAVCDLIQRCYAIACYKRDSLVAHGEMAAWDSVKENLEKLLAVLLA